MSQVTLRSRSFADDDELLAALKRGDEDAFGALVDRYGALMLRVAQGHVRTRAIAEEVVQETWAIVFANIGRFERRAALKTWIMRILANRAKTRGEREARCTPFSCVGAAPARDAGADADRLLGARDPRWPGHWACGLRRCCDLPEEHLLAGEVRGRLRTALACLPERQRTVVALRDVEGWTPEEVCDALGLSEGNQRVLLHRARRRMRAELGAYVECETAA
ncbi:MAG: RNA polymerase sigma factor [Solirubrobacteraceae bacterium]